MRECLRARHFRASLLLHTTCVSSCNWRTSCVAAKHTKKDKAISGKDVPSEWHDRTNRAVFTWQEPRRKGGTVSYEDRKSTWNSRVRKAIRRGSEEEEVRKHRHRVTGASKQISKQRRRVDVSYDPSLVSALQHGTWMDEEGFKKTCIKETKISHGSEGDHWGWRWQEIHQQPVF